MSGGRSGCWWCLGIGCALAGCGAQPVGAAPRPTISTASDAATPPPVVAAAAPPATSDAGPALASIDAGPTVQLAPTTLLTSADLTKAEVLAADADGVYWVTSDNQLWMLPTGADTPRQLAADPNPAPTGRLRPLPGGQRQRHLLVGLRRVAGVGAAPPDTQDGR